MVGSLRSVGGVIVPKPEDPPHASLVTIGLTPAQAYQAQFNIHSVSPPLSQNGRSHVSVDDVPRIGVQIEYDLNIDFGLDDHPESQRISPTIHQASYHGLNIGRIIHIGLLVKCPYQGGVLYADIRHPFTAILSPQVHIAAPQHRQPSPLSLS